MHDAIWIWWLHLIGLQCQTLVWWRESLRFRWDASFPSYRFDIMIFLHSKEIKSPKHIDLYIYILLLCNRSCLALCRAALRWWSTWFTSWLLCTTAASEKYTIFTCYVVSHECHVAELLFFCISGVQQKSLSPQVYTFR